MCGNTTIYPSYVYEYLDREFSISRTTKYIRIARTISVCGSSAVAFVVPDRAAAASAADEDILLILSPFRACRNIFTVVVVLLLVFSPQNLRY